MSLLKLKRKIDWAAFDGEWYKKQYHSVLSFFELSQDGEIEEFYKTKGRDLKHSPNPFFDESWYLQRYSDVRELVASGEYHSGFDHYVRVGNLSHSPHWLFDEEYYRRLYLDVSPETLRENNIRNGYDHYLNQGSRQLNSPSVFFDPSLFISENPDFKIDIEEGPYIALLRSVPEPAVYQKRMSWYFDPDWYVKTYPDVCEDGALWQGPLHHYLTNDTPLKYNPNQYFSEDFYLSCYVDIAGAVQNGGFRNGYEHFAKYGQYELRQPEPELSLRVYAENTKVKTEVAKYAKSSFFVYYVMNNGIIDQSGYTEEEIESISKDVYQRMSRLRLPLLLRSKIDFSCENPEVSIIIVAYNNFAMTMTTLASLRDNYDGRIQVILVDSGSSDEVKHIERYVNGLDIIRTVGNVGFLAGCNAALEKVKADYVLYLNNDLELMPLALETALARFVKEPEAGAVGAKIIRTNGLLQEAGCIIWQRGAASGYLRDQLPDVPEANYVRSVDFCSGAFLLVRTNILKELGGFDADYAPAYFEDTDLCVRINKMGFDVVYDPGVTVIHYEYGTSGSSGSNQLMLINQQRFIEKNSDYIEQRLPRHDGQLLYARSAYPSLKRVLFIEDYLPFRHLGSGFTRSNDIITVLTNCLGCHVTVYPVFRNTGEGDDVYSGFPDRAEIMWNKGIDDLTDFLKSRPGYYDAIWVARTHNAERVAPVLADVAGVMPGCKVILDTEAVAAGREQQKAALRGEQAQHSLDEMLRQEFRSAGVAQKFVAVNERDAATLRRLGMQDVTVLGHLQSPDRSAPGYDARKNLLFVGAVHDKDSPNLDSLIWFVTQVLPLLDGRLPDDVTFDVCGFCGADIDLAALLPHPRVRVLGRVDALAPVYNAHRVFVAPTRFAGGIPYKIHEAAAHGLPIVASDILREQVGWQDGTDMLACDHMNASSFAEAIVKLYTTSDLWGEIQHNALERIARENQPQAYINAIEKIIMM